MPDLPTVTVTPAQADRILLAFGGTLAVAVPAYKAWLAAQVREYVLRSAAHSAIAANNAALQAAIDEAGSALPPPPEEPPTPRTP